MKTLVWMALNVVSTLLITGQSIVSIVHSKVAWRQLFRNAPNEFSTKRAYFKAQAKKSYSAWQLHETGTSYLQGPAGLQLCRVEGRLITPTPDLDTHEFVVTTSFARTSANISKIICLILVLLPLTFFWTA